MKRLRFLCALFIALMCGTGEAQSPPGFVSGVWKKGHNITEPRPESSKFMKMFDAGFLVAGSDEAYRVNIDISPTTPTPYFIQATFENPKDAKKPFREETVISKPQRSASLTHGPVKGLRIYRDYRITIKLFHHKGDAEPFDVLVQTVRSYIDTTGPATKLKDGMKSGKL